MAGEATLPPVANLHFCAPGFARVSNSLRPLCARSCPSISHDEGTAPGARGAVVRQLDIIEAPITVATNIVTIRILATDSLIRCADRQDSATGRRLLR